MPIIKAQAVDLARRLNDSTWAAVAADPSLPQATKTSTYFHVRKPWIPEFASVVISPLESGLGGFLGQPVAQWEGATWYHPSLAWFLDHAVALHGPEGLGCDPEGHRSFLTKGGDRSIFAYANLMKNGDLRILERQDFEEECAFFQSGKEE